MNHLKLSPSYTKRRKEEETLDLKSKVCNALDLDMFNFLDMALQ